MKEQSNFRQLQFAFTALYPFLKIGFVGGETAPMSKDDGLLAVNMEGAQTVAQVVNEIRQIFGITVVIKRKLGMLWVAISLTSDWTLERQNREAASISQEDPLTFFH